MKYKPITRRYFLQGLGGSLLALPILPSLIPRAHASTLPKPKFLVIMGSEHGGTGYDDWYPTGLRDPSIIHSGLTEVQLFSGDGSLGLDHKIRWKRLSELLSAEPGHPAGDADGGQARLSYVFGSHFNPYINSMNLFRGIDVGPEYAGHGVGVISGNISGVANSDVYKGLGPTASLDQFLAGHPKFYQAGEDISLGGVTLAGRSLSFDSAGNNLPKHDSSTNNLFNALFSKYDKDPAKIAEAQRKSLLVDRTLEDFQSLTEGAFGLAKRISAEDKLVVQQHIQKLYELQTKLSSTINSCSDVTPPSANDWATRLDLIVAAFHCGATRLATVWCPVISDVSNYHQDIAHMASSDLAARVEHSTNFRKQGEQIVAPLLAKLQAADLGDGTSLFDQSLVYWQHESGAITHDAYSTNLVSFGNAGGELGTGYYLDYRNMSNYGLFNNKNDHLWPGLLVNQWWSTVLQTMGLSPTDFESGGEPGYGSRHRSTRYPYGSAGWHGHKSHLPYPERIYQEARKKLPIIG